MNIKSQILEIAPKFKIDLSAPKVSGEQYLKMALVISRRAEEPEDRAAFVASYPKNPSALRQAIERWQRGESGSSTSADEVVEDLLEHET